MYKYMMSLFVRIILLGVSIQSFGQSPSVRIGNFYYNAPNGIAFINNDEAAFVMDPDLGENKNAVVFIQKPVIQGKEYEVYQNHLGNSYNAGTVAPDDSYHRIIMQLSNNALVTFEWSRVGDAVVARLISDSPQQLTFKVDKNWPGFKSTFSVLPDGLRGVADTSKGKVEWVMKSSPAPRSVDDKTMTLSLKGSASSPTCFVAGFGTPPSMDKVDMLLAEAAEKYQTTRPQAHGPSGDVVAAMTDNINNSRLYSSHDGMLAITVSRTFGVDSANVFPIFCWDSFFNGLMASIDNPEMAKSTFRAVLSGQLPSGMIPGVSHWIVGPSKSNSQPPVGAMCIWKAHLRHPDIEFLAEVYPKLTAWHAWWMKRRNATGNGLLHWGSEEENFDHAMYETGWDDTPHFRGVDGVRMEGTAMNVYAVDLNAMWAMDAHYLSLMADALGKKADAKKYSQQRDDMNARMNARLWNEELGIYCSRFFDDEKGNEGDFLTRLTPINFYPLMSGAASKKQADEVLSVMADPNQFWGEWIVPTVSRQDPLFQNQRYWSGTIWAPCNYLVWLGVKKYASPELKAEYAQKSVQLFMNNWLGAGLCGENYFSLNGRVGCNPNYTWGALLCLIGIESVLDIDDAGTPVIGNGYNEPVTLKNIPVMGQLYGAEIQAEFKGILESPAVR